MIFVDLFRASRCNFVGPAGIKFGVGKNHFREKHGLFVGGNMLEGLLIVFAFSFFCQSLYIFGQNTICGEICFQAELYFRANVFISTYTVYLPWPLGNMFEET